MGFNKEDSEALFKASHYEHSDTLEVFAQAWVIRELNYWLTRYDMVYEEDYASTCNYISKLIDISKCTFMLTSDAKRFEEEYTEKFNKWLSYYMTVEFRE